jgi:hypothetical protein
LIFVVACGRVGFDGPADARIDDGIDARIDDGIDATACAYQLCDDFEGDALASVWGAPTGTVAVDSSVSHSGVSSVHFHTPAVGSNTDLRASITDTSVIALGSAELHVRMFMRFAGVPATNNEGPILSTAESVTDFENSIILRPAELALYNQWNDSSTGNAMPVPTDTWLCVLLTLDRSTTTSGALALGGDVAPITMPNIQTDGPPLTWLSFGIIMYAARVQANQPALDVWMDDLLVADTELSCSD